MNGSRHRQPRAHSADGRVWLGVRPEKVRLALPGEDAPTTHNQVRGVLTDTCYAGVSTEYLLKTPWGQEMSVFSANAAAGEPLQPGTEVVAHWYPPHSFVLDRPTGEGDEVDPVLGRPARGGPVTALVGAAAGTGPAHRLPHRRPPAGAGGVDAVPVCCCPAGCGCCCSSWCRRSSSPARACTTGPAAWNWATRRRSRSATTSTRSPRTGRISCGPRCTPASRRSSAWCSATRWPTRSRRRSGRWRNLLLVCVIAPFFTTFLVRTLAWKSILSDNGAGGRVLPVAAVLPGRLPAARHARRRGVRAGVQLPAVHGAAAVREPGTPGRQAVGGRR